MGETHGQHVPSAHPHYGQLLNVNSIRSIGFGIFDIYRFLPGTDLSRCVEIVGVNTAFGSTSNIVSVSVGRMAMRTKSRSSTTTKRANAPVSRRLPSERAPTHPGEMLRAEFIEPLGITQTAFAARLGVSFPRLNEIIKARRSVTPDTALRLARLLGMPADFWLGLQSDWDLWHAMHSDKAAEIEALTPLELS